MNSCKFLKRKLGDTLTRPFGYVLVVFGLGIVIGTSDILAVIIAMPFILSGMIFAFGKEMTEINQDENYFRQYFQLFFLKLGRKEPIPSISYILVKDFRIKVHFYTMTDDAEYYEISFITIDRRKKILAYSKSKKKANAILSKLKFFPDINIIDKTTKQISKIAP
ncbi:MAG: hypothetical protein JW801_13475 [Bacteroidales bacterium]|nr:hypothetical protein [Bacteroidales bacterium]